jgi:hypothetical protein
MKIPTILFLLNHVSAGWIWLGGSSSANERGFFGRKNTTADVNIPPSVAGHAYASATSNSYFYFGGWSSTHT